MRVVAGAARGRLLHAPAGGYTRPTSDRVREAVFNILTSMDAIEGASVVDLFAGSGALGIEALSRGARLAVFVDHDRRAVDAVRANLAVLDDPGAASVVRADAMRWAGGLAAGAAFDVIFADPPYAWEGWGPLMTALDGHATLVVAETAGPWEPGPGWRIARSRRYGTTLITVLRSGAATSADDIQTDAPPTDGPQEVTDPRLTLFRPARPQET